MDFKEIKGFEQQKRALEVAAAGAHPILIIGGMGTGKTMLTEALMTITDVPVVVYEGITDFSKPQREKVWDEIKANVRHVICTTLPCPCGQLFSNRLKCICSATEVKKQWLKFAGATDLIGIHIHTRALGQEDIAYKGVIEDSATVKKRVMEAQTLIDNTYGGLAQHLTTTDLAAVKMNDTAAALLKNAYEKLGFTTGQRENVIRIAVSIAALYGHTALEARDIAEAVQYQGGRP